ncbi:unnamed protein product, partial [Didymodactylos carnosus]
QLFSNFNSPKIHIFSLPIDDEKSILNLNNENSLFIFQQLIVEVLVTKCNTHTNESKQDLLNHCRLYYKHDLCELKKIDDFEENYRSTKAIRWYTRDSFLYRLINKSL